MSDVQEPSSKEASLEGWSEPKPEHIPSPTFWPAGLALGITFLFWGIITSLVVVAVGFGVFVVSLAGWIGEMRHEAKR